MHVKTKIRDLVRNLIVNSPVKHYRDAIRNRQTVKNVVLDSTQPAPVSLSQSPGGLLRILATDEANAKAIRETIEQKKSHFGIKSTHIANRAIDSYPTRPKEVPLYRHSVLVKLETKSLLESATSILEPSAYKKRLKQDLLEGNEEKREKIVIDFSSPNIAKPFHFGHLKSTILGNFLANLNKLLDNEVTKLNYIGDWGTQFGLLSVGLDELGVVSDEDPQQSALKYLLDIYVKANELAQNDESFYSRARERFLAMDKNSDSEQLARWLSIKQLSIKELEHSYSDIGVRFDVFEYESDYAKSVVEVVERMRARKFVRQLEDGVLVAQVEKNNKVLDIPVLKSDGASLYISRDVAAALKRKERYNFDRMLYVVGADQEKHFHCLKQIVKGLGHDWHEQLEHVKIGKVAGMSSRSGTYVLLSDIIQETTSRYIQTTKDTPTTKVQSKHELEEVGKHLALSALFVFDLRNARTRNYDFSWDSVLLSTPRSGIHLQTTFARTSSLLMKADDVGLMPITSPADLLSDAVCCSEAMDLMSELDELDTALHSSYCSLDAAPLVNHALDLCKSINRAMRCDRLRVLDESDERKARTRLSLFRSAHSQLEMIIKLIGLKPLYKV